MKYRFLLFYFFLISFSLIASNSEKTKDGIIYKTDQGFIRLQVYTENIIRITVSPVEYLKERESLMVISGSNGGIKWNVAENDRYISLFTKKIKAEIDKKNFTVSFYKSTGELILRGGTYHFTKGSDHGETVFEIEQKFKPSSDEALYGLGQFQDGVMNWRGHDATLFQDNTVAVVPVIVSTRNYGILWDNYSLTKFHDGKDGMRISSEIADAIDYYFISGSDLDHVVSGYRFLTGKVPMFGKWAYGYWQSKERYNTQREIVDVVREYRKRELPLDNIVQDWMYWGKHGWSALEFDRDKFPDPEEMIKTIHENHTHIMISIWPNFAAKTRVYREMKSKGLLIGSDDVNERGLYDAYNPEARDLYWKWLNKNFFSIGMDAWWMDATEPEMGGDSLEEKITHFKQLGNNYLGSMARYMLPFSLMSTKGVYEHQRKTTDKKRVFILTRSAYAGQQRYAAVTWSGDIHAQWHVLHDQIPAGLNFCATGIPYWTTDIGAFIPDNPLGNKDNAYREIYLRWFQYGVFNPIFRSHGSGTAREIWNFGEEGTWTYKPLKKFDDLRYRLLPYIYSMAWQVTKNDYTIMRGLAFDFNNDPNVYNIDNQYMFGPAFLVRPVTEKMYYENNYLGELITGDVLYDKNGKRGNLTAEFFNGIEFDTLVATDNRKKIDFDWNDGVSLPKGIHKYYYSIRFSGEIQPEETGKYTFLTTSNDGIRVTIDGKVIIENWTPHGATVDTGEIELKANKKYKIKVEYFQTLGGAVIKLAWIRPGVAAKLKSHKLPPTKSVQVYLPDGSDWFDFWRGNSFKGGQNVNTPAPIDEIPLYVRSGSIILMGPFIQYADEKPADPIELRVYTGADGEFTFYEDEGDSYNYEKGIYATIPIKWNEKKQTLTIGDRKGNYPGMLKNRTIKIIWVNSGHGVGLEPAKNPDRIVKYSGKKMVIRK